MAGDKDGQHLIAHLLIAHGLAGVYITGFDQHIQQIAAGCTGGPALTNHRIDHCIQRTQALLERTIERGRPSQGEAQRVLDLVLGVTHPDRHRRTELSGLAHHVRAEHCLRDNVERYPCHLRRNVHHAAGWERLPPPQHALSRGRDFVCHRRQPFAMKHRLHHPALPEPGLLIAVSQETVPGHRSQTMLLIKLRKLMVVLDKDMVGQIGMREDVDDTRPDTVADDLAVLLKSAYHRAQIIPGEAAKTADQGLTTWSWSELCRRGSDGRTFHTFLQFIDIWRSTTCSRGAAYICGGRSMIMDRYDLVKLVERAQVYSRCRDGDPRARLLAGRAGLPAPRVGHGDGCATGRGRFDGVYARQGIVKRAVNIDR